MADSATKNNNKKLCNEITEMNIEWLVRQTLESIKDYKLTLTIAQSRSF